MKKTFEEKITCLLVEKKCITREEAIALCKDFSGRSSDESFDAFLINEGIVAREEMLKVLSEYYKVPSFDVIGYFFKPELLHLFTEEFLVHHTVIPLELGEMTMSLVAGTPDDEDLQREIAELVSYDIQWYVGISNDIQDALVDYYENSPFKEEASYDDDFGQDAYTLEDLDDIE